MRAALSGLEDAIAHRATVSKGARASIWWITISSIKPNRDHIDPGLLAIADCCARCRCILSCHIIPPPREAGGDNAYRIESPSSSLTLALISCFLPNSYIADEAGNKRIP